MKHVSIAVRGFIFWTIVTAGIYPLLMTGIGALFFPQKAHGSLVTRDGKVIGSTLLAQDFQGDAWFHPRPSAAKYDPTSSGASNEGYTSADLKKSYEQRKADWQKANGNSTPPMDMLFASGSGLDPHISPPAAELQVPRVAAARHLTEDKTAQLRALVARYEEAPQLGFLGEPRVNVLRLNIALDEAFPVQK